ncbi:MAG TPA: ATP-binding protein [Magnetospirillum sp.]|nr:ATP-binding protein [Magnetospirillum sp.]
MGISHVPTRLSVRTLGIIAALVINTVAALALWQAYNNAIGRAEQRTQALAQIYADFTYRALDTYDQILVDLQGSVEIGLDRPMLQNYLRRQKEHHVHLLNLFVFDADGTIVSGTQDRPADLSDRDYVVAHRDDSDVGRFVGQPSLSRIIPGRRFLPLSRRISGPDGDYRGVVAATIDLKELGDAFDAVREQAEGLDVAITLLHHDGTLLVRSPAAADMIGQKFRLGTLEGDRVRTVHSQSPFDGQTRIVTQRQVPHYPLMALASLPKSTVIAEWSHTAVPAVAVALLLTAALVVLAGHLHREAVGRETLLRDLAAAKERAEEAFSSLSQAQDMMVRNEKLAALGGLVAGIAHEINTPVGNAVTAASFLAKETQELRHALDQQTLTASTLKAYLDNADESARLTLSNCERAAELIHGFKQVAVDQTSGERRRFNLAEYVAEVLLSLKPQFKRTPHRVDIYIPDDIELDSFPGALSQVLTNLMVNSLIHGFEDGRAGVIDLAARLDGDMVELVYSDNGRGIPLEVQPQVFEPFFTTRRGSGGSGLGLNIVHNIVHRTLGGTLALDSREDRGVHFTIRIPARAPAASADPGSQGPSP